MMKYLSVLLLFFVGFTSCDQIAGDGATDTQRPVSPDGSHLPPAKAGGAEAGGSAYAEEIREWRANRISNLKRPRGWTSLVGLTWLKEGRNTFGSASDNNIRIEGAAPDKVGVWTVDGDNIQLTVSQGVDVYLEDGSVFNDGEVPVEGGSSSLMFNMGSLYWTIIKRSELYGVRVWDTSFHLRHDLSEIPHYNTDIQWKLAAIITPAAEGASVTMDNAVGQSIESPIEGYVRASKDGVDIELLALNGGPDNLFLIFSDLTTDIETYPGGRYMYIPRGDSLGNTVLDFNKAYNPPCAFTAFATCLLPPKSNFIGVEVRSGEKEYGLH